MILDDLRCSYINSHPQKTSPQVVVGISWAQPPKGCWRRQPWTFDAPSAAGGERGSSNPCHAARWLGFFGYQKWVTKNIHEQEMVVWLVFMLES